MVKKENEAIMLLLENIQDSVKTLKIDVNERLDEQKIEIKEGFNEIKRITNKHWDHINQHTSDIIIIQKELFSNGSPGLIEKNRKLREDFESHKIFTRTEKEKILKKYNEKLDTHNENLNLLEKALEKRVEESEKWIEKIETAAKTTKIVFATIGTGLGIFITFILKFIN